MIDFRGEIMGEMKCVFCEDQKRINHAESVLGYAEQILQAEGGDEQVVVAAAILHDIGIHQAERKYGSSAGRYQEIEGPGIARGILEKYDFDEETIEHVCKIIANHHSAKDIDTKEFRIIWDADWIVNWPEEMGDLSKEEQKRKIERIFKTAKGREIAEKLYLNE